MNVDLFKDQFISKTSSVFSWKENSGSNSEGVELDTYWYLRSYQNEFEINVQFYNGGALVVDFVFAPIYKSEDSLKLVNNFNENVPFLNAFITPARRGYCLVIRKALMTTSIEQAVDAAIDALQYFDSDNVAPYMQPLDVIVG